MMVSNNFDISLYKRRQCNGTWKYLENRYAEFVFNKVITIRKFTNTIEFLVKN